MYGRFTPKHSRTQVVAHGKVYLIENYAQDVRYAVVPRMAMSGDAQDVRYAVVPILTRM